MMLLLEEQQGVTREGGRATPVPEHTCLLRGRRKTPQAFVGMTAWCGNSTVRTEGMVCLFARFLGVGVATIVHVLEEERTERAVHVENMGDYADPEASAN
jgi:hypothetical protein